MKKLLFVFMIFLSILMIHSCTKTNGDSSNDISTGTSDQVSEYDYTEIFSPYYTSYLDEFIESTKKGYIVNQYVRWVDTTDFKNYIEAVKDRDKIPIAVAKNNSQFDTIRLVEDMVGYCVDINTPEETYIQIYFKLLSEEDKNKTINDLLAIETKENESQVELLEGNGVFGDYYYNNIKRPGKTSTSIFDTFVYFKYDDFLITVKVIVYDETEEWHEKCFDYFNIEMVDIK